MDFDLSKENIQPLRGGRNATQLGTALQAQNDSEYQKELLQQKEEFENIIKNYKGPDPLENWYNYISWIEQSYPKHGHEGNLAALLEDCLGKFEYDQRYLQDRRLCKLFIKYFDLQHNPLELFQLLYSRGFGTNFTDFYRAWAYYYEASGDFKRADHIFQLGFQANAQPPEELKLAYDNFTMAVGRHVLRGSADTNHLAEKRRALTSLRAYKHKHRTIVPSQRTGANVVDYLPGTIKSVNEPSRSSNYRVDVFQDSGEEGIAGPSQSTSSSAKPKSILDSASKQSAHKENLIKPGPWNNAFQKKSGIPSSSINFTVHEDDAEQEQAKQENNCSSTPPIQQPAVAATVNHFADLDVELFIPEPNNNTKISQYNINEVYVNNNEFSFEELNTRKYFERKKLMEQQVKQEQQQMYQQHNYITNYDNNYHGNDNSGGNGEQHQTTTPLKQRLSVLKVTSPTIDSTIDQQQIMHEGGGIVNGITDRRKPISSNLMEAFNNSHDKQNNLPQNTPEEVAKAVESISSASTKLWNNTPEPPVRNDSITTHTKEAMYEVNNLWADTNQYSYHQDYQKQNFTIHEDVVDDNQQIHQQNYLMQNQHHQQQQQQQPQQQPFAIYSDNYDYQQQQPTHAAAQQHQMTQMHQHQMHTNQHQLMSPNQHHQIPQQSPHQLPQQSPHQIPQQSPHQIPQSPHQMHHQQNQHQMHQQNAHQLHQMHHQQSPHQMHHQQSAHQMHHQQSAHQMHQQSPHQLHHQQNQHQMHQQSPHQMQHQLQQQQQHHLQAAATQHQLQHNQHQHYNNQIQQHYNNQQYHQQQQQQQPQTPINQQQHHRMVNNYDETTVSTQMFNFNLQNTNISTPYNDRKMQQHQHQQQQAANTLLYQQQQHQQQQQQQQQQHYVSPLPGGAYNVHQKMLSPTVDHNNSYNQTISPMQHHYSQIPPTSVSTPLNHSNARQELFPQYSKVNVTPIPQQNTVATPQQQQQQPQTQPPVSTPTSTVNAYQNYIQNQQYNMITNDQQQQKMNDETIHEKTGNKLSVILENSKEYRSMSSAGAGQSSSSGSSGSTLKNTLATTPGRESSLSAIKEMSPASSVSGASRDTCVDITNNKCKSKSIGMEYEVGEAMLQLSQEIYLNDEQKDEPSDYAGSNNNHTQNNYLRGSVDIYVDQNSKHSTDSYSSPPKDDNQQEDVMDWDEHSTNSMDYAIGCQNLSAILTSDKPVNPFDPKVIDCLLKKARFPNIRHTTGYIKVQQIPKISPKDSVFLKNDKYLIDKVLGKGTFGTVFKANNMTDGGIVAVKYQRPSNFWEFYICKEIQHRIKESMLLLSFMDITKCYYCKNSSLFISEFSKYGSLLNVANKVKKVTGKQFKEVVTYHFVAEMIRIVAALHQCQIIHADIKPDNFLVMRLPPDSGGRLSLQLIDFGCSIDMTLFPSDMCFYQVVTTEDFTCTEMREGKPWTYQTDLFCIAATAYVILMGEYMKVKKEDGDWTVLKRFPRYVNLEIWRPFFRQLLNIESCDNLPDLTQMQAHFQSILNERHSDLTYELRQIANIMNDR